MTATEVAAEVWRALAAVDDPEYPGISIVDMGMVGACSVSAGHAHVVLVPTFTGCPALDFIESDVQSAVASVGGVDRVSVEFDRSTVWDTRRLTATARERMAEQYTVAVALPSRSTPCPRCGHEALVETSMFGPTRCRSIHRCRDCGETVEVVRA
jgi:ring-1,2-phenylacetyl-CoA epoxidase subunit PaaD